ncbi:transporter [Oceanihabitans sediminis]|uniref:Transporter n=1 Tax=Oceanihabitans sediminis TaxID=1812012 RepID=A0A368P751_9FLAO|nr:transporter [Oceanihabitans sediminis]MDX1278066.1 transporter [Oceanihabitans sediminis]RBP34580.1 outer membrane putative beta-barrel porin/alpha-amylase [Oceanihabitans sediminis]RCU58243.1 transporter [Oceanihabitans sediminis]
MKFNKLRILSIGVFVSSLSTPSFAQETKVEPLITDRPDATESATPIQKGFIQIETGAFYESNEQHNIKFKKHTYNTTLVRYGLLDNLELRLGWDVSEEKIENKHQIEISSGLSPLLLGFKTGIAKENGLLPEIGVLGHLYLPFTASEDYKPKTTGVDLIFSFSHTISEKSSFAYNLGASWQDDSAKASYIYSIAYSQSITDKIDTYIELFGDFPEKNKANHFWNTGITYLISNNFQLDCSVGTSITKGQDILLSIGASFRIPSKTNKT